MANNSGGKSTLIYKSVKLERGGKDWCIPRIYIASLLSTTLRQLFKIYERYAL